MDNLETAYNQALQMLKQGHSQEEVLLKFAEFRQELAPLLETSSALLSVPKNIAPTPLKRRKYALAKAKGFWFAWLHMSRLAGVSVSVMLLVSASLATGYVAKNSVPGQTLFALKKAGENVQLLLAGSQAQKASVQVGIAQSRLNDAQVIFSDPASNAAQKTAALTELSAQTSNAVATVGDAANNDPKSAQNHPLVSSLDAINKQQQVLLAGIKPDSQIQSAANNALQTLDANSAKLLAIKQSIAITSSDQSLATLNANPNAVAIFGEINQASSSQVTVEKLSFIVNAQTVIKDADGNTLEAQDLATGTKANVLGIKNQNSLVADQILVAGAAPAVATSSQPEVKSAVTQTSGNAGATTSTSSASAVGKKPAAGTDNTEAPQPTSTDNTTLQSNPNSAAGLFIYEDPSPQFAK